jgi:FADH2 O2-dependent halogenase
MPDRYDFVVFGSGFGGSIMSMVLRKLGHSVLLLERGSHPRFVIGESSTPFANLLLEKLAAEYDLPFLRALSEWGTWQKSFPNIACGLKRGFTFYYHEPGREVNFANRDMQLLVAASPNDPVADTHWYRPAFDHFLVEQAQKLGVEYIDNMEIESCAHANGWQLKLRRLKERHEIFATFAIDASGQSGFLAKFLQIPTRQFADFPRTHAVYAHFRNVRRLDLLTSFGDCAPPYRPEDAAVHHVFGGGWVWVLRFNNGLTSAGAALKSEPAGNPEESWRDLLGRFPSLDQQFQTAKAVTPFYSIPRISFRRARAAGPDWALLPSAAGFVDPLLSTGFALNLLGISRLARAFTESDFEAYEEQTFTELDAAADLVGALYAKMNSFPEFAALSLLYFAAMSFTETAWRLEKQHLAEMFLLSSDARFSRLRKDLCAAARRGERLRLPQIAKLLEPWDIAGLGDLRRRNWYPVAFEDLLNAGHKLDAGAEEIRALLLKSGISAPIASVAPELL